MGPPRKGKAKASGSSAGQDFQEGSTVFITSRVAPGSALFAKPEGFNMVTVLDGAVSGTSLGMANVGTSADAGSSQIRNDNPYGPDAWHEAHNPFDRHPFQ
jgi:2-methylisocitrate lyase-like PEP mutase family enzyme